MRQELMEALSYPRQLVQRDIDTRECPHHSLFEVRSQRCQTCELKQECHWVRCLNDFGDFASMPAYTINASLRYGMQLVEERHAARQAGEGECSCDACTWLRDAQRLSAEFERRLPASPYRPMH